MKYTILLIDGSPGSAIEIEGLVAVAGGELRVCRGRDELDDALERQPDLALIASELAGAADFDWCTAVRQGHASTRTVLLGGSPGTSPDFDDYLELPVTETAFLALLGRQFGAKMDDPREESRQLEDAIDHLGRQRVGRRSGSRSQRPHREHAGASQTNFLRDLDPDPATAPAPPEESRQPQTLTEADIEGVTSAMLAGPSVDDPSRIPDLPGEIADPATDADIDAHLDMLFATGDGPTPSPATPATPSTAPPTATTAAAEQAEQEDPVAPDEPLLDPELIVADTPAAVATPVVSSPAEEPSPPQSASVVGRASVAPAFQTSAMLGAEPVPEASATHSPTPAAPVSKLGTRRVAMLAGACVIVITAVLIFFAQKRSSTPGVATGDAASPTIAVASTGTVTTLPAPATSDPTSATGAPDSSAGAPVDEEPSNPTGEAGAAGDTRDSGDSGDSRETPEAGKTSAPPKTGQPKLDPVVVAAAPPKVPASERKPSSSNDRRPSPKPIETAVPTTTLTSARPTASGTDTADPKPATPPATTSTEPGTAADGTGNAPIVAAADDVPADLASDETAEPEATTPPRTTGSEQPDVEPTAATERAPTPAPVTIVELPPVPAEGFAPPEITRRSEPNYTPRDVKQAGFDRVVLRVLVNDRGMVVRVVVQEGEPGSVLVSSAIDAILRSTFRPATEDGQPVQAWKTETFTF